MSWATVEQRRQMGEVRRQQVKRSEHDALRVKARSSTALEVLEGSMRGRVAKLIPLKKQLMAASPFGYFRGAVPVMAADLALLPSTGLACQICGDAHVRNLGAYAAPDGRLVFDMNDFDETIRAPFEWDLKRMAASLILAGREAGHADHQAEAAAVAFVQRYVNQMQEFASMPLFEVSRFEVHRAGAVLAVHDALRKAERATPLHTRDQLTEVTAAGRRQFREMAPHLTRPGKAQAAQVVESLGLYRQTIEPQRRHLLSFYRPVDVAFKVVGTGSVGLRDYCIYMEGNGPEDPLFLQIKEETASAWAPYLHEGAGHVHEGQRVVEGQRAIERVSDPFLGWSSIGGRSYLVRQLNDHKASIEMEDLAGDGLQAYAELCGELLARGHARSGDPVTLAGYLGAGAGFAEAVAAFGLRYADQTERDWQDLCKALKVTRKVTASAVAKRG